MRQIYTSPRLQNIDRVIALLAEHGIETTVTDRSNYRHPSYDRPSYSARDSGAHWPKVWIVRADDFTRARAVLREIGLEPLGRYSDALPTPLPGSRASRPRGTLALRIRLVLLAIIALLMLLMTLRHFGVG